MKYYSVGINNTWTKEPTTIDSITSKGLKVADSRLHGDKDVFSNGSKIATLFENQNDQKDFLKSKGLI